jgi:hypothetical protein
MSDGGVQQQGLSGTPVVVPWLGTRVICCLTDSDVTARDTVTGIEVRLNVLYFVGRVGRTLRFQIPVDGA